MHSGCVHSWILIAVTQWPPSLANGFYPYELQPSRCVLVCSVIIFLIPWSAGPSFSSLWDPWPIDIYWSVLWDTPWPRIRSITLRSIYLHHKNHGALQLVHAFCLHPICFFWWRLYRYVEKMRTRDLDEGSWRNANSSATQVQNRQHLYFSTFSPYLNLCNCQWVTESPAFVVS
jgi:hypothetical protein